MDSDAIIRSIIEMVGHWLALLQTPFFLLAPG